VPARSLSSSARATSSAGMETQTLQSRQSAALTIADSPLVFVVKCLLFPFIAVLTLLGCLKILDEPLRGGYLLIAVLTFLGVSEFLGIARIGASDSRRRRRYVLMDITARWFVLIGFVGILTYLAGLAPSFNYRPLAAWALVTPFALYAGQFAARYLLTRSRVATGGRRRAVIVGLTDLGVRVEEALRTDELLRTQVVGYFEDRGTDRLTLHGATPILGSAKELAAYVTHNNIEQVYITLPMNPGPRIMSMFDALHDSTASIYFVPDLFAFDVIQARFDSLNGIPIVAVRETPFYGASWVLKRVSDIAIATVVLAILAVPVLLVVALAIRLDSPGPIIFKQKRYGLDGREILVYKFRSMRVTEDGKEKFTAATRTDTRVTRVGAFIRKTSLDELPQLFNVLEGRMSIVGPRPHPVAMNEHYRRAIPSYMVRHKVKPGITGWAQVNGYRGGDDLESMRKRIELDLAYLRHWSLWLDLRILLKTITVVWTDRSAY
jgi:putative colanic acid biosynthesis UDP-glucose lipid carrier transferase